MSVCAESVGRSGSASNCCNGHDVADMDVPGDPQQGDPQASATTMPRTRGDIEPNMASVLLRCVSYTSLVGVAGIQVPEQSAVTSPYPNLISSTRLAWCKTETTLLSRPPFDGLSQESAFTLLGWAARSAEQGSEKPASAVATVLVPAPVSAHGVLCTRLPA